MIILDLSSIKILLYCNSLKQFTQKDIQNHFNLNTRECRDIMHFLRDNGYITYIGDIYYKSSSKGKLILKTLLIEWLSKNILAIIAIVISIIALFK